MSISIMLALGASLLGLYASSYVHRKKRLKQKLLCPRRANCDRVIHSTHATTLGIPNELLGMAYYCIVGMLYAALGVLPALFLTPLVSAVIAILTLIGILFTLYLISIQLFVLRAWCAWCMLSAVATVLLVCSALGMHFFG